MGDRICLVTLLRAPTASSLAADSNLRARLDFGSLVMFHIRSTSLCYIYLMKTKVVPNPTFLMGYKAFQKSRDRDADAFMVAMRLPDEDIQLIELFENGWHHWTTGFEVAQERAERSLLRALRTRFHF